MKRTILLTATLAFLGQAQAFDLIGKAKELGKATADIVETTVTDTADTVDKLATGRRDDPAKVRSALDQMAANTLAKLYQQDPAASRLMESAYGYAVFDSRVSSFGITTGFGKGVAVRRSDDKHTYMRMASGGVNVGMGVQYFQAIFFFPDAKTYDYFVDVGWDGGADATGAAGKDAESMAMVMANGVRVYQLNEKGVMLKVALTGTKYWKQDDWNKPAP